MKEKQTKQLTNPEKIADGLGKTFTRIINSLLRTKILDPTVPMAPENLANMSLKLGPGAVQNLRADITALLDLFTLSLKCKGVVMPSQHFCFFESKEARDFTSHIQAERVRQTAIHEHANNKHDFPKWGELIRKQTVDLEREAKGFDMRVAKSAARERCTHELVCIAALAQAAYEHTICKVGTDAVEEEAIAVEKGDNDHARKIDSRIAL